MTNPFIETITSADPGTRNRSIQELCDGLSMRQLLESCAELEAFRRSSENLYESVRTSVFLYYIFRFRLMERHDMPPVGHIPFNGYEDLLNRRFEEALGIFLSVLKTGGPNGTICSALADCYHLLTFQTLTRQVRRSVRASLGNQWMFRVGHASDHPIHIRPEMLERPVGSALFPILCEKTPVRMDLSHSGWSDIFFLAMDYPEAARVMNISVDLGVYGRDAEPRPPIETYIRIIEEPILRLTSVDLEATKDIHDLEDLFNFGNDYLGLLKAGVVASGVAPASFEGTNQTLESILGAIVRPGMGLELTTKVNDIPKGSRLAVSTNLLASIISVLMRATGQTQSIEGPLTERERRLAASRAILGEWLGGSGGGWQDSGGLWPGIKIIQGAVAGENDPEYGISRGCLLPRHRVLGKKDLASGVEEALSESLVLIHGGMAQNVGPILEMVTEKYLLRGAAETLARQEMHGIFDEIVEALRKGDIARLGSLTNRNWNPIRTIIPEATNPFTETILARARQRFGKDFLGFLMLGGMSGGGMANFVKPKRRDEYRDAILEIMLETKAELEDATPFAMDPVVYDFRINNDGSSARFLRERERMMPARYYALQVPEMLQLDSGATGYARKSDLDHFTANCTEEKELLRVLRIMVNNLFRVSGQLASSQKNAWDEESDRIKAENGFDPVQHEKTREDLRRGRIGLARNRLPIDTDIRDVEPGDAVVASDAITGSIRLVGEKAIREGRAAVVSLAGGLGSRWTSGAGVVKAANPFTLMAGRHRSFLEIHLAKSRQTGLESDCEIPHVLTTSYLTHKPVAKHLALNENYGFTGPLYLSPGRSIGMRLTPMARDLMFLWEETAQEILDENKQRMRENVRAALIEWARSSGEGSDYVDNIPIQRFNPPGHWYEIPNLILNGVLGQMLAERPELEYLMVHNIDTLGASLDPEILGLHIDSGSTLSFEVTPRRIEDRGGGLARVNGQVRLLEGLAQPRESDEFKLSYYNSLTTWIGIDPLLAAFGLTREDLAGSPEPLAEAVRAMAARMPTYVTIKDVKRRWGHGQEDIFPVAQFEKLWGDMTSLPDIASGFIVVSRQRGQQLKSPAQLDAWTNDGSKDHVAGLCGFA